MGLCSAVACMQFFPSWTLERRQRVALAVLQLHTALKVDWRADLLAGQLRVPMQAIHLDVAAPWLGSDSMAAMPVSEAVFMFTCPSGCGQ
eukprot:12743853-Alexandrium_andersonii.AAC.1